MNGTRALYLMLCAWFVGMALSSTALANSTTQGGKFVGEVVKVSFVSIVIRGMEGNREEVREFFSSSGMLLPGKFQIGDYVSVRYEPRIEEIQLLNTESRVEPEFDSNSLNSGIPGVPGVIDDRAFYGAENSHFPSINSDLSVVFNVNSVGT